MNALLRDLLDSKVYPPFFLVDDHDFRLWYIELARAQEAKEAVIVVSLGNEPFLVLELLSEGVEGLLLGGLPMESRDQDILSRLIIDVRSPAYGEVANTSGKRISFGRHRGVLE